MKGVSPPSPWGGVSTTPRGCLSCMRKVKGKVPEILVQGGRLQRHTEPVGVHHLGRLLGGRQAIEHRVIRGDQDGPVRGQRRQPTLHLLQRRVLPLRGGVGQARYKGGQDNFTVTTFLEVAECGGGQARVAPHPCTQCTWFDGTNVPGMYMCGEYEDGDPSATNSSM